MKLKKFNELNENFEVDDTLKTKLDSINIDIWVENEKEDLNNSKIKGTIESINYPSAIIIWDYQLSVSNDAIDYITTSILTIELHVEVESYEDDSEEPTMTELEYTYTNMNSNIEVTYDDDIQKMPFQPTEIEINKTLIVGGEVKPKITIIF